MRQSLHTLIGVAALALSVGPLAGCNIVAPIFYAVHGPPKTKPLYQLQPRRPTVVFVDDRSNIAPRRVLRSTIARRAEQELLDRGVLVNVIDSRAAFRVASEDSLSNPMPIGAIGEAVGAEVIIYVSLDSFTLSPQDGGSKPAASASVKVLDVTNKARLWPVGTSRGYPLRVALPVAPNYGTMNNTARLKVQNSLAETLGLGVAQLFYTHETSQSVQGR